MSTNPNERLIRAAFAPARQLEPTDAEVAAVLARAGEPRSWRAVARRSRALASSTPGWRRVAIPALTAVVLGASAYAAVPPLRAAVDDVADTFAGYLAGDGSQAPGRPLRPGESAAHGFLRGSGEPRVIAEADGYQLQFVREEDGYIGFALGETGVGLGYSLESLSGHAVYVLGPGAMQNADEDGHVPLFGVTSPQVQTVELTYASGRPLRVDGIEGGFVLLAEPDRLPQEVIGHNAVGEEVERVPVQYIDWDGFGPAAPRVPIDCQPGIAGRNPSPHCPGG